MRELLATGADVEGSPAQQQLERHASNFKMARRDWDLFPISNSADAPCLLLQHTFCKACSTWTPDAAERCSGLALHFMCVCSYGHWVAARLCGAPPPGCSTAWWGR